MRRFMLLGFASFAFAAGFGAARLNTVAFAQAAPPSLTPQIIDLSCNDRCPNRPASSEYGNLAHQDFGEHAIWDSRRSDG